MPTPQPKARDVRCSECDLPWDLHGPDPTLEDCIRLLKVELAKRPTVRTPVPSEPRPWPMPLTAPGRAWRRLEVQ